MCDCPLTGSGGEVSLRLINSKLPLVILMCPAEASTSITDNEKRGWTQLRVEKANKRYIIYDITMRLRSVDCIERLCAILCVWHVWRGEGGYVHAFN